MAAAPWAVPLSAITASALASARCRLDGLGGGGLVCPPFCAAVSRARLGEGTDLCVGLIRAARFFPGQFPRVRGVTRDHDPLYEG